MAEVINLNVLPSECSVLRRLPHLSAQAQSFVLAVLSFRRVTGVHGVKRLSDIGRAYDIDVSDQVVGELIDAGVFATGADGVMRFHPAIISMMAPNAGYSTRPASVVRIGKGRSQNNAPVYECA